MARRADQAPSRTETRKSNKWIDGKWVTVVETLRVESANEFFARLAEKDDEWYAQNARAYSLLMSDS